MGGVIAAHLASIYPQVKKLVLVAPAFRYFYFKDGKVNIKGMNDTLKNLPDIMKNMGTEKVLERITKTPIATMLEFTKLVNSCLEDTKKITCPTLIIRGTRGAAGVAEKAANLCAIKNGDSYFSLFLLGILCNIFIFRLFKITIN